MSNSQPIYKIMNKKLKIHTRHLKILVLSLPIFFFISGFRFPEKEIQYSFRNGGTNLSGKQLFETRCNICHGLKDKTSTMLAPPFFNIKSKYSKIFRTKASFEKAIVNFVSNPQKENTLMFGAVKQFGVMPKLGYPKNELLIIAEYIYETPFQRPTWCSYRKNSPFR